MNVGATSSIIIMVIYLLISIVFERPFCNYLCTESPKYGVVSLARVFTITRDKDKCVGCKKCDKEYPMNIKVSTCSQVRNGQCINCFKCMEVCPSKGTLHYQKVFGKKKK